LLRNALVGNWHDSDEPIAAEHVRSLG